MTEQYLETTDESQIPRRVYRSGDQSFVINGDGTAAINQLGWIYVGTFDDGFTISAANEYASDGLGYYRWAGTLPKTVASGSTPADSGGVDSDAWVLVKLDAAENVSDEDGTNVQDALYTVNQRVFAPWLTQFGQTKVSRILYVGTSIEASSASAFRCWFESLKNEFGDSGNFTQIAAGLGGNFTDPYEGWDKQPFSGLKKHRIRGESTSNAITLSNGAVSRILIRYSTETNGGSFDVDVDGTYFATIDCNGAQSMANELNIEFDDIALHTITLNPPASGYAYVENIDWCLDNPGIQIMDGTYGGSMLQNYIIDRSPPQGNQVEPVPVVGDTGLEHLFNNQSELTKPDLIILPYTVNDAGRGLNNVEAYSIPTFNKIIGYAQDSGTHVLVCCEMGGHYTLPSSSYNDAFLAMRNAILSARLNYNVTLIDWHWLSGLATADETMLETLAYRYYGVTDLDVAAGTFGGDFIHPNSLGNAPLGDALHTLTGSKPIVPVGTSLGTSPQWFESATTLTQDAEMYGEYLIGANGIARDYTNQLGVDNRYTLIGSMRNIVSLRPEPLWYCADEIAFGDIYDTEIENSTESDRYGKYVDLSSSNKYVFSPVGTETPGKYATYTFMVGTGSTSIRIKRYDNSAAMPLSILGETGIDGEDVYNFDNMTDKPKIFGVTIELTDSRQLVVFTGRLYKAWLTATDFACIPGRVVTKPKYISSTQVATEGLPLSDVIEGQAYMDGEIEKVALSRPCVNSVTRDTESLYRCVDCSNRYLMEMYGTLVDQGYSDVLGGPHYTSSGNVIWTGGPAITEADAGSRYGLVLPGMSAVPGFKVILYAGSINDTKYLTEAGTWTSTNTTLKIDAYRGMPIHIPVTLPADAGDYGGASYALRVQFSGNSDHFSRFITLCSGVLATV